MLLLYFRRIVEKRSETFPGMNQKQVYLSKGTLLYKYPRLEESMCLVKFGKIISLIFYEHYCPKPKSSGTIDSSVSLFFSLFFSIVSVNRYCRLHL